jgi:hypothetical protein
MHLNEICYKVHIGKHLFDRFLIKNVLKEGNSLLLLLSTLLWNMLLGRSEGTRRD